MAITVSASGSVAAADLHSLRIFRDSTGGLTAEVEFFFIGPTGKRRTRAVTWSLSASDKSTVASLVPSAIAAIEAALSL